MAEQKPKKRQTGRRPTLKQIRFQQLLAKHGGKKSLMEIGRMAGYAEGFIDSGKFYAPGNARMRPIADALERQGVTLEKIAKKIDEGLDAEALHLFNRKIGESTAADGSLVIEHEIHRETSPDYRTRAVYADLALKARGDIQQEAPSAQGDAPVTLANLTVNQLIQIEGIIVKGLDGKKK